MLTFLSVSTEAIAMAAYLKNCSAMLALEDEKTPYEFSTQFESSESLWLFSIFPHTRLQLKEVS